MDELFFTKLTNFIVSMSRYEKVALITKKILFGFLSILNSHSLFLLFLLVINDIEFGFTHWTIVFFGCAPFVNAFIAVLVTTSIYSCHF